MADLTPAVAKKFFASLYAKPTVGTAGDYEAMATRVVAKLGKSVTAGDHALQSLMFNYILADSTRTEKGMKLSAVLANIKQRSVAEFTKAFPKANLNELVSAAKEAGYDVEILG